MLNRTASRGGSQLITLRMKQALLSFFTFFLITVSVHAQQALGYGSNLKSPEINPDGSVTLRFFSPKAVSVKVVGDFLPDAASSKQNSQVQSEYEMVQDSEGVWSFTSFPLEPELYSYYFVVNGERRDDPSNIYKIRDVVTWSDYFIVSRKADDRGALYSINNVPHGNISKIWYESPSIGSLRRMTVYTPAGYADKANRNRRYPVMYLLHGGGGDENSWSDLGRAAQIIDNLIASGEAEEMIVVMPNGNVDDAAAPGEWSLGLYQPTFFGNIPRDFHSKVSMAESFLDIVGYIDSHYRTIPERNFRAICGLSMGGGQSYQISMKYPSVFGWIGLFSAGFKMWEGDTRPELVSENSSPELQGAMASLFSYKPKLYYIGIGETDERLKYEKALCEYFDRHDYGPYEFVATPGGHIWRNWRIYLSQFARQLFK